MSWFEIISERKIREAQEEGVFDNLPGRGKPLNLDVDLRVPPELRTVYRLMREANVLPDWIALDKEVRQRQERWQAGAETFARSFATAHAELGPKPARAACERLDGRREAFLDQAAKELRELNRMIDRLNLIVPTPAQQRLRLDLRERMEALETTLPRLLARRDAAAPAWERYLEEPRPPTTLANRMPLRRRKPAL
jgi:hypothetical protein